MKSLQRIHRYSRSHERREDQRAYRSWRLRLTVVATFILGVVLVLATSAAAEITPGCSASINGQSVEKLSSTNPDHAIPVQEGTTVPVSGQAPSEISHVLIKMEAAGFQWTVRDAPTSGTSWQNTVPVDRYAKYGAGLYKVVAESTGGQKCVAAALVDVQVNPLSTAAGIAAAIITAVGALGTIGTAAMSAREASAPRETPLG